MERVSGQESGTARREWKAHGTVVLAGFAGVAISTMNTYSTGIFMEPLQHDFGWSRAEISGGPTIAAFVSVVMAPFIGILIDRYGPRRIGIAGVIALCLLTALLSQAGPSIVSWWATWCGLAAINGFIMPSVFTAGVSSFFTRSRGFALAVVLCGSGFGSIVTPILSYQLVAHFGWRGGYVAFASVWAVAVLPLIFLFLTSRRDQDRRVAREGGLAHALTIRSTGPSGMRTARFAKLTLAAFLIASVVVSLTVTIVPILSSSGMSRGSAAAIAASLGFASIAGRLTIGHLLDKLPGRFLAAFAVCMPIISCVLLISFPGSTTGAIAAVLLIGVALGAELDIVAYLTTRYFRLENFGLLFGTLGGVVTLAGGSIPTLINAVYDRTHSYVPALWAFMPMCAASAVMFLALGSYPDAIGGGSPPD